MANRGETKLGIPQPLAALQWHSHSWLCHGAPAATYLLSPSSQSARCQPPPLTNNDHPPGRVDDLAERPA
jgi:hypothetical protein